ncbi:MAG: DUF4573 domain-containing protein [Acutalibacteraceae bacterium]
MEVPYPPVQVHPAHLKRIRMNPAHPASLIHPVHPANLIHPVHPANLIHPAHPVNLIHPAHPVNLIHPVNPAHLKSYRKQVCFGGLYLYLPLLDYCLLL